MRLFGSSGIRGLVNEKITPELAMNTGLAVGSLYKSAIIGYDPRTSNHMVANAVASGLMATGCGTSVAGLVSTPTLAYAARNFDCGIMITASHNPPEYNGIKLWNPDGMAFDVEQMEKVEELIFSKNFKLAEWQNIPTSTDYKGTVEEHIEKILSETPESKLKVVVDCGNGSGTTITPFLLQRMGCRVVTVNAQPDGTFPGRPSEPSEENLQMLMNIVKSTGADLGIANDGDADRMVAVDEKGNYVGGDKLMGLFALKEVKKKIVVPVNVSMALDDILPNAEVIRTKVGDVFVSMDIKKHEADFGGEPSGTWIFPKHSYCPDGIYAAAKLVEIAGSEKLSEQVARIPSYHLLREGFEYPAERKEEILGALNEELSFIECQDLNTLDGIRLGFEDSWVLVRPSGTEPKVRVTAEARTKEKAEEQFGKFKRIVKEIIG